MILKINCSSSSVNLAYTVFSNFLNMNDPVFSSNQGISATAFLYIACVFSSKRIEKSYDAIFLGMISKIKTARHTSELK